VISGPFSEFTDFDDWLHLRKNFAHIGYFETWPHAIKRFAQGIGCIGVTVGIQMFIINPQYTIT